MIGLRKLEINTTNKTALPILFSAVLVLSACATTGKGDAKIVASEADPYEPMNRAFYSFNNKIDDYIAEPISDVYRAITPQLLQTGVFNFFNNLDNINTVINDFLQGKGSQGIEDTGRFVMNSTFGLLGLFDVAKSIGLQQNNEDFDQTLAVWGVARGPYLIIPFIGPTTLRGIPGAIFDTATNPSTYVGAPVQLISILNKRANAEGSLKFIDEAALDPYVFTRESFLQWRTGLATDGKSEQTTDFDDDLGAEDEAAPPKSRQSEKAAPSLQQDPFKKVSDSFQSTSQSFESTAESFKILNGKLDKLKK